ncbi:MAG: diguanylate cyclase/phosphodiesterase (GGDEF & EAL domains) with PAS/PAC sensor(s), partial [uncultured Thermoleophilia bacterium]
MTVAPPTFLAAVGEGEGLLLVEDNRADARLFELLLEDGWPDAPPVHVCTRLADARARMLERRPLCVLVDLSLPDARRLDAVHVIRAADPTVPIVVLSGQDDAALGIEAMGAGAQDYLLKGRLDGALVARSIRYAVERKRAENALRESHDLAARAFDDAAVGMALITLEGAFLRVNGALCRLLGYDEAELLTSTPSALTHADDLDGGILFLHRLLDGGLDAYELEKRFRHADGHVVSVQIHVALMRDALDRPLHIIAQFQDVTAQRRAEGYRLAQHAATRALAEAGSLAEAHTDVLGALCRSL